MQHPLLWGEIPKFWRSDHLNLRYKENTISSVRFFLDHPLWITLCISWPSWFLPYKTHLIDCLIAPFIAYVFRTVLGSIALFLCAWEGTRLDLRWSFYSYKDIPIDWLFKFFLYFLEWFKLKDPWVETKIEYFSQWWQILKEIII
jgi:hypothetical protein